MTITVGAPTIDLDSAGSHRVSAQIQGPGVDVQLWYRSQHAIAACPETFVAATLLPAMASGATMRVEAPVSPLFLSNLVALQDTMAAWYKQLRPVEIECPIRPAGGTPDGHEKLSFFSGGVDSFATVVRHREEITHLLLIRGFDIPLSSVDLWERVKGELTDAASELRLELITVETNAKELLNRAGDWGLITHGAGLASVGLLFGDCADRVFIPSTHHVTDLFPWGSHPLLDHLWSTETLRFVHDGGHLTRVEKTAMIAQNQAAMRHLRVCYKNVQGAYNCGECEKCVRTMIGLSLAGRLRECLTFSEDLDRKRLRSVYLTSENDAAFARENLARALELQRVDIASALQSQLWSFDVRRSLDRVKVLARQTPLRSLVTRLTTGQWN